MKYPYSCPKCGAKYIATEFKIQSRTREDWSCEKCGEVFVEGKVSKVFTFTLIKEEGEE